MERNEKIYVYIDDMTCRNDHGVRHCYCLENMYIYLMLYIAFVYCLITVRSDGFKEWRCLPPPSGDFSIFPTEKRISTISHKLQKFFAENSRPPVRQS